MMGTSEALAYCAGPMSGRLAVPVLEMPVLVNEPLPAPLAAARLTVKYPVEGATQGVTPLA